MNGPFKYIAETKMLSRTIKCLQNLYGRFESDSRLHIFSIDHSVCALTLLSCFAPPRLWGQAGASLDPKPARLHSPRMARTWPDLPTAPRNSDSLVLGIRCGEECYRQFHCLRPRTNSMVARYKFTGHAIPADSRYGPEELSFLVLHQQGRTLALPVDKVHS